MNCPKCGSSLEDGTLFCSKCGISSEAEELEKTMAIPVVRTTGRADNIDVPRQNPSPKPKAEKEPAVQKQGIGSWQIFVIAFLVTVVVCLSVALVYVLLGRETLPEIVTTQNQTIQTKSDTNKETKEETDKEFSEGESIGVDDEVYGIRIDTEYSFKNKITIGSEALSYKTMRGSDYRCDVPSEFGFVYENDGEIRYEAKDGTAYMDIGSFENKSSLNLTQIKEKAVGDIGGKQISSHTEDIRYSVSVDRGGIIYHHKCILSGGNIIYYELVYPKEYSEIYDVYVSDIDESFDILGQN